MSTTSTQTSLRIARLQQQKQGCIDIPPTVTAKRRRTVTKPDGTLDTRIVLNKMRKTSLIDLPFEVLGDIIGNLDMSDAVSLLSTCKYMKSVMHPDGSTGGRIWNQLRKRERWPDPNVVGISDYQFLKSKYGRGCNFCSDAPRVRTPKWEFGGVRMCEQCIHDHTTRHYTLGRVEESRCRYLPSIEMNGWKRGRTWSYKLYLTKSIPDHNLTETEKEEMRGKLDAMDVFLQEMHANETRMETARRKKLRELVVKRASEVKECMESTFPDLHPKLYNSFKSYHNASRKSTLFSKRSRGLFVRSVEKELEENRLRFYRLQSDLHLHDICQTEELICSFTREEKERIHNDLKDFLTYAEVESKMAPVIHDKLRTRRQNEWSTKYIFGHMNEYDEAELRRSLPYISGLSEDERDFAELAQKVYQRVNRRAEWVQKYLRESPGTIWAGQDDKALLETDVFKTALPENEYIFADLAKTVCERATRRNEWWKKYVDDNPDAKGVFLRELFEIDVFRTANEGQEHDFAEQVKICITTLGNWTAEFTEETVELSKTERILWCQKCRYCSNVGATFDLITQHRSRCKGRIGVLKT